MVSQIQPVAKPEVLYPESDGKPMADNTKQFSLQFRWIVVIQQNLEWLFANDPNVFVAADLLDDFKGLGVPGAIALGPDGTGKDNDGLLTSDEILDMNLNAELVVLSACDTGQGRITGDGVIRLSRSLFRAGVPSVMVSLWKVPDASTAFLMTQFYKNLQHSSDQARALQQAMLSTKQNTQIRWIGQRLR